MQHVIRLGVIGVVVSACSGGDSPQLGPEVAPTPVQQSAIMSNVRSLSAVAQANLEGQAASAAALDLAFAAPSLLGIAVGIGAAPPPGERPPASAAGTSQLGPDGCEVVATGSITWNQCQDNGATIDGTMTWSPGRIDLDVHASETSATLQLAYGFTAGMAISDTAIQGDTDIAIDATGDGRSDHTAIHSQLDVRLAMGCIYDGTLTVVETGAARHALQVVWIGCNMFQVRNG